MRQLKTALMYAADLLARQEHSEQHLREKLRRKGYEEEETEAALAKLKERHYLNDEEACARQFDYFYRESRKSVRQICLKLEQRGFEHSLVRACVPDDIFERECKSALRTLEVKYKPSADQQKLKAGLYRQGFSVSVCEAAVRAFLEEHEEEEE